MLNKQQENSVLTTPPVVIFMGVEEVSNSNPYDVYEWDQHSRGTHKNERDRPRDRQRMHQTTNK